MELVNQLVDYLNANPAVVAGIAGLIAVLLQYGINHIKSIGRFSNYFLALLALPGVTTAIAAEFTSLHFTALPGVVLLSQVMYAVYEKIKANAAGNVLAATPAAPTVQGDIEQRF